MFVWILLVGKSGIGTIFGIYKERDESNINNLRSEIFQDEEGSAEACADKTYIEIGR